MCQSMSIPPLAAPFCKPSVTDCKRYETSMMSGSGQAAANIPTPTSSSVLSPSLATRHEGGNFPSATLQSGFWQEGEANLPLQTLKRLILQGLSLPLKVKILPDMLHCSAIGKRTSKLLHGSSSTFGT